MTKTAEVFQLRVEEYMFDTVNSVGWDAAANKYPEIDAYLNVQLGSKGYKDSYADLYGYVATVNDIHSLEEVFDVMNGGYAKEGQVVKIGENLHSLSVGDVVSIDRVAYMVDVFGFTPLPKGSFFID